MEVRYHNSPKETSRMNTAEIRENFLIESLMENNQVKLVYSHYDRVIIGGCKPVSEKLALPNHEELRADYFLQRRELGIINVGGDGEVFVDDKVYSLRKLDALYVGKGSQKVKFSSKNSDDPALFYLLSAPAHKEYPTHLLTKEEASPTTLGDQSTANKRTIYKYIHADGIQSCQLVMGLTILAEGSIWNTIPSHTHSRRMEAYFYFDIKPGQKVFHLMGEPTETRHIVVGNHQAIISPPWSIHSGAGTAAYGFIWGMAGENYNYADMDPVSLDEMK